MSEHVQALDRWRGRLVAACAAEIAELPARALWEHGLPACPEECCRAVETPQGHPYLLCITGAGMVAAAAAAAHLTDVHRVGLIIAVGFMGRLTQRLPVQSLALVTRTANYGALAGLSSPQPADADLVCPRHARIEFLHLARTVALDRGIDLIDSVVISAQAPLHDANSGRLLRELFDADGVDMETAAIAEVVEHRECAWLSLRTPSDNADEHARRDHERARARGIPDTASKVIEEIVARLVPTVVGSSSGQAQDGNGAAEAALLRADRNVVFHPFSRPDPNDDQAPRVIDRAFGVRVWDVRGRCYYDGMAGTKNVCLGHGHPAVLPFVNEAGSRLSHWPADGYTTDALVAFSSRLASLLPLPSCHVFANSGGSEAVETAFRMAREYHRCRGEGQRYRVLALSGGYHGATAGAMAATGHAASRVGVGPLPEGTVFVDPPADDDPSEVQRALIQLERAVEVADPDSFSCFIFEPTQGLGGVRPLPAAFIRGIIDAARDTGALAVVDEIASGLGRTGRWFDCLRADRTPDIITCGKALTNGTIPLSATAASAAVHDVIAARCSTLRHGHTYSGHPLAAAAACRVLDALVKLDVVARVAERAGEFERSAAHRLARLPCVAEVRTAGLWVGIDIRRADDDETHPIRAISRALLRRGLLHETLGATLSLSPPLTIAQTDWSAIMVLLTTTLEEAT